jgi:hypothetical protein
VCRRIFLGADRQVVTKGAGKTHADFFGDIEAKNIVANKKRTANLKSPIGCKFQFSRVRVGSRSRIEFGPNVSVYGVLPTCITA